MAGVLDDLKGYTQLHAIVTSEELKSLYSAITNGKIYIKNVYRHEIEMHSTIKRTFVVYGRAFSEFYFKSEKPVK